MSAILERVKTISYDEVLKERFKKDPQEVVDYLSAMLESPKEPELFLLALGRVARAFGMTELANTTGLGRESLYKTLSVEGNPTLKTLLSLLDAMDLQLAVVRKNTEAEIQEEEQQ
ncbi:MAG: addiction module antidote protein [Blastocatellia bacterium]|jgi:probable addiction module antidote protein